MNWKRLMKITKFLFVFFWIIPIVWASQYRESHNFENMCADCHVDLENPKSFTRDPEILCLACHPEQQESSHPSGVIPKRVLPAEFPLYKGKLICTSCHIAHTTHDEKDVQQKSVANTPSLLRVGQPGKVFCSQCHGGNGLDNKVDAHALVFQRAHNLGHDMSLKAVRDDHSPECLDCHEGTRGSHPIGIEYQQMYLKNPDQYHPAASLNSRIRLIHGEIGCQSCHDHYSEHPYLLVMEHGSDKLCLQCHNL
jgi:predicted CXXCH cytochrome family protein